MDWSFQEPLFSRISLTQAMVALRGKQYVFSLLMAPSQAPQASDEQDWGSNKHACAMYLISKELLSIEEIMVNIYAKPVRRSSNWFDEQLYIVNFYQGYNAWLYEIDYSTSSYLFQLSVFIFD